MNVVVVPGNAAMPAVYWARSADSSLGFHRGRSARAPVLRRCSRHEGTGGRSRRAARLRAWRREAVENGTGDGLVSCDGSPDCGTGQARPLRRGRQAAGRDKPVPYDGARQAAGRDNAARSPPPLVSQPPGGSTSLHFTPQTNNSSNFFSVPGPPIDPRRPRRSCRRAPARRTAWSARPPASAS